MAAERAGLRGGDAVLQMKPEVKAPWINLKGFMPYEVSLMMRGVIGTQVSLQVVRDGVATPFVVSALRETGRNADRR